MYMPQGLHRHSQGLRVCGQAVAHERRAQGMREALDAQVTSGWREFQAVASVLVTAGALEAGTFRVGAPALPQTCQAPCRHHCSQILHAAGANSWWGQALKGLYV